jgi:hypothetical protein
MINKSDLGMSYVFGIGDYKTGIYKMTEGFEELKAAIESQVEDLLNRRRLRLQSSENFFPNREWTPRVVFALVLRKYLYQAFLCGTDRVFISDHQTFSGFFKYEIVNDKMTIDYYVINDPETVAYGITLRSAIAGIFYKNVTEAFDTKVKLEKYFMVASRLAGKAEGLDPFGNVLPRATSGSPGKLFDSQFSDKLVSIQENIDGEDFDEIHGNTYCRIIYDAAKRYPNLILPRTVFVKLYYYSNRLWEENDLMCLTIPEKKGYGMFFNEFVVNGKIAKSQFGSYFPKLLVSGYWNGLPDHPMHIFESLGKQISMEEWNMDNVHEVIKSRLEELHLLGISHNDVRKANIHVSVSGEISLIDFGLSDCSNNEGLKANDIKSLDQVFGKHCREGKYGIDNNNSFEEAIFDEMSLESHDTRTTKEDNTPKKLIYNG